MSGDQEPWVFRGGLQAELQVCMTAQKDHWIIFIRFTKSFLDDAELSLLHNWRRNQIVEHFVHYYMLISGY